MRRAVLTPPIPLTPTLSPSDGEREKARRTPCHSLIQRQWGWGEGEGRVLPNGYELEVAPPTIWPRIRQSWLEITPQRSGR